MTGRDFTIEADAVTEPASLTYVGFDSAWADNPRKPGAICALRLARGEPPAFHPPQAAGFDAALAFIRERHAAGAVTLVAIDQPTVVRNEGGARPVERLVASVMSFSGGGIQPAYRGTNKADLFGDAAPIWRFLAALGFADDPERAAGAGDGGFVMEVFPALALLGLEPAFLAAARTGPRYNPGRPTFLLPAWRAVCRTAAAEARRLGLAAVADWCEALPVESKPRKREQDALDAVICLLVAARWRADRAGCLMLGDLDQGYIVAPANVALRERLARSPFSAQVPCR